MVASKLWKTRIMCVSVKLWMICCRYLSWENKCSMCRVLFMVIENKQPYSQLCEQLWWFYAWLIYALIFYNSKSAVCKQMLPTIGYFKGNCWYSMFLSNALTMTCMHAYNKKNQVAQASIKSITLLFNSIHPTMSQWKHDFIIDGPIKFVPTNKDGLWSHCCGQRQWHC